MDPIHQHFRDRWATLLSVDDIVDAVHTKLGEQGLLGKTFMFYSSDHGYKQGQWRVGTR
jgi:glucan phosphoethanolaminetransferase (alkaline phosphatase superfamily)